MALDTLAQRIRAKIRFRAGGKDVLAFDPPDRDTTSAVACCSACRIDDAKTGNGDGLVQVGEDIELVVRVRNGEGNAKIMSSLRSFA